ncbi:MAG: peptidase T [Lachnospiraceae bacterium]|nr:peptidase T [Lachnospiraceae bacterium]
MDTAFFYEKTKERMIRYAKVDTQSSRTSQTTPTTKKQFDLARMLCDELREIGAAEVFLDEAHCVVYGKLPANDEALSGKEHALGFVTHMDTAPDASGENVKPWVLENYRGGDIVLNEAEQIVMEEAVYPQLAQYVGQDLILTDGTTLLGADDKAGIAAVMTAAEYLCLHPDIRHGLVSIAFTPDEEVGGLAKDLDLVRFEAPVAYTVDCDWLGCYSDETFNASDALLTIRGTSVHTGTAKGIMVNAAEIAAEYIAMFPQDEKPQHTEGREGFFHLVAVKGDCEEAMVWHIVRDFDAGLFAAREEKIRSFAAKLGERYGEERISLEIRPTYRNMKEVIDTVPHTVAKLEEAFHAAGIEHPVKVAFRGGTDGSALSHRGLPAVNISAGYENAHGRFEFVPVQSMVKNTEVLLHLVAAFKK